MPVYQFAQVSFLASTHSDGPIEQRAVCLMCMDRETALWAREQFYGLVDGQEGIFITDVAKMQRLESGVFSVSIGNVTEEQETPTADFDAAIGWVIVDHLCANGWEPFAALADGLGREYCFRRVLAP